MKPRQPQRERNQTIFIFLSGEDGDWQYTEYGPYNFFYGP